MTVDDVRTVADVPALDRVGRAQLVALFVWTVLTLGLVGVDAVRKLRAEPTDSPRVWAISFGISTAAALIAVALQYRTWRRQGGQPWVRRSRAAWRTEALPSAPAARARVLHALEQRRIAMERQVLPWAVIGLFWLVDAVFQIAADPSPTNVAGWVLLGATLVGLAVQKMRDERRSAQLRHVIWALQRSVPTP